MWGNVYQKLCRLGISAYEIYGLDKGALIYLRHSRNLTTTSRILMGSKSKDSNNGDGLSEDFDVDLSKVEKQKLNIIHDELSKNSYYEKYKNKILDAQKSSPREFLAKLEEKLNTKFFKKPQHGYKQSIRHVDKRKLDDFMKVTMIEELSKDEIKYIWQEFHKSSGLPSAIFSFDTFRKMMKNGEKFPMFVLPLPRKDGHEFMLVQYESDCFYFTPMISYRVYKENSPVCLTLINFTELGDSKGLILMRGEFDKNVISLKEAQMLSVQTHLYFANPTDTRVKFLKSFNKNPEDFDYLEVVSHLKEMEQDYEDFFPK